MNKTHRSSVQLSESSIATADAGIYPSKGRSIRLNVILSRFEIMYGEILQELMHVISIADIEVLAAVYIKLGDKSNSTWMQSWAENNRDDGLASRILDLSPAQAAALEEWVARSAARSG